MTQVVDFVKFFLYKLSTGKSILDLPSPRVYTGHMSPLSTTNNLLRQETYHVVDTIIGHIEHLPHGYAWWHGLLPRTGHNNVGIIRKRWVNVILATLFPPSFVTSLITASILPNGKPNGPLYTWVLTHLYANDVTRLYTDWFAIKEGK